MIRSAVQPTRTLRVGVVVLTMLLGVIQMSCEAHHPITAQYVAQGRRAHSVTVLPIEHPGVSPEKAKQQAEQIAERIRRFHPEVQVLVGDTPVGEPVSHVVKYAKGSVSTGHFVHGHIWDATAKRPYNEIEISERITRNGREVWSLSAKFDDTDSDAAWESGMDAALNKLLDRLPGSKM